MARTAKTVWVEGAMVDVADAKLPLMGHASQRGSLVFDVGSFHSTDEGGVSLFRVREHVSRFIRSCRIVGLAIRHDEETLVRAAVDVVRASAARDGLIRWTATFAAEEPDLLPRDATALVAVAVQILEDPPRSKPIAVATFEDARKAAPDVLSPEAKAAAAYLGPMLAKRRAVAAGADDVVLLDLEGFVAEAPIANVFAVVDGALHTPPLGRILPGITRDAILTIAKHERIDVHEAPLSRRALQTASEAFLTATSMPLYAIGRVDEHVKGGAPGPVTRRILAKLTDAQHARDATYAAWSLAL